MPEDSPFIQWLGQLTKLLFVQPASLLTFVQLGIAVNIFALSQLFSTRAGLEDYERRFSDETLLPTRSEIVFYQQRRRFIRFLTAVGGAGVGYFLAIPILLLLMTFPNPSPNEAPGLLFVILSNSAFFLTFIPAAYITIFFVYYRTRLYRFH